MNRTSTTIFVMLLVTGAVMTFVINGKVNKLLTLISLIPETTAALCK